MDTEARDDFVVLADAVLEQPHGDGGDVVVDVVAADAVVWSRDCCWQLRPRWPRP